ncbi:hypothetical protein CYLTODRAFT_357651 [Cylindrobasidium torrendii FP15055 ss-10]|uniref:MAPEG-domain-containing protein n=1 Tax=Cylindrobasidium torrendii FP15055 ss-10 TaxID=1314674 RepID=A0A0D7B602_9AGAR|nr:hypothetical protein CYLTODRAFT_357651 [Cylindrobasidium torrendii FP15055 ss-10]
MAITITLPEGWAWTATALFSTQILLAVQMTLVNKYRKLAGIAYPQMYAEKSEAAASRAAYVFNCAQRAHQNTLENVTVVFMGTGMTALYHPYVAAASCGLWVFGRALYTRGYIQNPDLVSDFRSS